MYTRAAQHHERHSAEHARNVAELEMWWNPAAQDEAAWNAPISEDPPLTIEEMKIRESRMHVDLVQDMVPFWIRGVEAAEKGEVLRLEHFLETLQEASDAWLHSTSETPQLHANSEQGWGQWDKNWGRVNAWEMRSTSANGSRNRSESDSPVRRRRQTVKGGRQRQMESRRGRNIKRERESFTDAFDFVEHVARQQSADEEQKRRMHNFFHVRQITYIRVRDSCFTIVFQMPTHEKIKKIDEVVQYLHGIHEH
jgi:hypothetical protein